MTRYIVGAGVVIVIAAAAAWWSMMPEDKTDASHSIPVAAPAETQSPSPQQQAALPPADQHVDPMVAAALTERAIGRPDAPVTIVEYASMTCPHCAAFHNEQFEALKERYIDTGKVRLVFQNFILNTVDLRASMMARCAPDGQFFGLVKVLFRSQGNWARSTDPVAELAKLGRLAGIDEKTFEACMSSEPLIDGLVKLREQGSAAGVISTPTFVINGERVVGGHTIDELAAIIDPLLKN